MILGPLDMYELPYLKMYHHDHIPMHYVLMVGYDEELQKIYIYDCDRTELQELSYEQLRLAWNKEKNVVGDKNGFIRFSLSDDTPGVEEIASRSLQRKAKEQLTEKPYMIGASAFKKIAREFPKWRQQMSEEMYRSTLKYLTEFWGTVPKLPNRLLGINDQKDIHYCGGLDRFGSCLMIMGNSYQKNNWTAAGTLFQHAGERIEQVTDLIIRYLCDGEDERKRIPQLFLETGELIQKAYEQIGQEDEIR